ncbi:MAG: protein translocase subunit SecF [Oscillospiraceae bacterium]|nr:protein translocase subunit SecF [Oscillospiraceae bacterium]MDD7295331.1 protein translocase subunit SecF [Oscillospiraceae bacterium]MDY2509595.1 protein translocase subunit SecF [Ruminococcus callidus]
MAEKEKQYKHYPVDVKVRNFCGKSKLFFLLTLILVVIAIASSFTGVDIALEFKGGTIITYSYEGDVDKSAISKDLTDLIGTNVNVQDGESLDSGSKTLSLSFTSTEGLTVDRQVEVTDAIQARYPDANIQLLDSNDVSARSGSDFFAKCIVAAIFAAVVLILYIAFRFKQISGWSAGVCAIIGLLATLVVTYGAVVLMGFEIDSNFMAVILTLLGYAVNDTIVIYDRIRENQQKMPGMYIEELVNTSCSQSLRRSIRTSTTTFFAMIAIIVVAAIMGLDSIQHFAIPMAVGIVVGTYHSICFVPSLWVWWQKKRGVETLKVIEKKKKHATN